MAPAFRFLSYKLYKIQITNIKYCFTRVLSNDFSTKVCSSNSSKVVKNIEEALDGLKDEDVLLVGGFGICGVPENLICGVMKKKPKNLTLVSGTGGTDYFGAGLLVKEKLVKRIISSYIGENEAIEKQFFSGDLEVELTPQGSFAERLRAGGAGIPAFYTPCGLGTLVHEGGAPIKYAGGENMGEIEVVSTGKPDAEFNGKSYVLETAITGDFALAKAWKADTAGNVIFKKSARNFNPACLVAAKVGVVEVEEIVPVGCLSPEEIHLPGIYVDRVFLGTSFEKKIEKRTVRRSSSTAAKSKATPAQAMRERIARRVAIEFSDGMYVNLGIGIPCLASNYIPAGMNVTLQSENGVLGLGPHPTEDQVDPDLTNAGKELATITPGGCFLKSEDVFAMIRGGHLDITVLGAMQVSRYGDISSWMVPGKLVKGMGGAMDLVSAPNTKVIVAMEHMAKDGAHKILDTCDLPLTGKSCVDMIITDKCVFKVDAEEGLTLLELAEGVEVSDIMASVGAEFQVAEHVIPMQQVPVDE